MLRNPDVSPIEQGCVIIEDTIQDRFEEIRNGILEIVEPFVVALPNGSNEGFDALACNLITGIDRSKAFQPSALQVAKRTFAVSQLVMGATFMREPELDTHGLVDECVKIAGSSEQGMIDIYNRLSQSFEQSKWFGAIMRECQFSIDPNVDELEVFEMFGGFVLQSVALGEAKRVRQELESAAGMFSSFDGDLWKMFDQ